MKNAIEIQKLKKKYKAGFELGEINLNIKSGCIIGLIGENGAGKTTLIKSILNITHIDQGSIKIFGKDIKDSESEIKEEVGVVLDNMFFPEILNTKDIDSIMKGIYQKWDTKLFFEYLDRFSISKNQQIKTLSKGMQKKLEIATTLSHHPKLLILDEPTSGLDPVVRNEILDLFLKFISDEDHTVLLSTHITSDLEHIADTIIFMNHGDIILENTRDEIMDNYGILKCDISYLKEIPKEDIIRYKKGKYDCQVLLKDITKNRKKYKGSIIDKITLEDLMVLMIKGEKI